MRNSILLLCLWICGCGTKYLPYHSTADIPHLTTRGATAMTFIRGDEDRANRRRYAVIAAIDDGTLSYVLIAPANPGVSYVDDLSEAYVGQGAPLSLENANDLIAGLADVLNTWELQLNHEDGRFYEFMQAPEQDLVQLSPNVIQWRPTIRFNYNHTHRGPVAGLSIRDDLIAYSFEFKKREEIDDLRSLLQAAVRWLQ